MIRYLLLVLLAFTITNAYTQNIIWLQGTWNGKAYLPGSNARQLYNVQLIINATKGNRFEGIIKTIQPSDTSVHFDSRISGTVYEKYLVINRDKILFVKDPTDAHWQLSCNNCKPPHMIFSMKDGSITFSGEVKDCFKTCNGISEFSKEVNEFNVQGKESLFAFASSAQIAIPGNISFVNDSIAELPKKDIPLVVVPAPVEERIAILPAGSVVFDTHNNIASDKPKVPVQLSKMATLKIGQNNLVQKRTMVLPAGDIVKIKRKIASPFSQKSMHLLLIKMPSLVVKQNKKPVAQNKNLVIGAAVPPVRDNPVLVKQEKSPTIDTIVSVHINNTLVSNKTVPPKLKDTISLLPAGYEERKKEVVKTITVNTDSITLVVYDNGIVDGDIVSVVYNNQVVIDKLSLTSRTFIIKIPVNITGINTLVFHAHNLGEFPPNTAKLEILFGNKKEELLLSSDFTVSSEINIIHQ